MMKSRLIFLLPSALLLSACSPDQDELREWMKQQEREIRPSVQPLEVPKKFNPQPYLGSEGIEPFSVQKMAASAKNDSRPANPLLTAELDRRKEPLESYPLDTMTMVGSVVKRGQPLALIQVDRLLYSVRVGEYMGQNYGRIMKITETELTLREVVQDAAGEWVERVGTLQLQEKAR